MELALASRARRATVAQLEPIPEEPPQIQEQMPQVLEPQIPEPQQPILLNQSTAVPDLSAIDVEKDIAYLPTQKLAPASQKRPSQEDLNTSQTKIPRCGYVSFTESESQKLVPPQPEIVEKENIPDNWQTMSARQEQPIIPDIEIHRPSDPERVLTSLLQELTSRRRGSHSSETMLGSLDRTKVSLGESNQTTDSKRFIRDQWGTEGTMVKIWQMVKAEIHPVNIDSLMSFGPMVPGYKRIIAARCFTSILRLKQHGFIKVTKDPETLEILDIFLGSKFNIS